MIKKPNFIRFNFEKTNLELWMNVSEILKSAREEKGLSLKDIAMKTKISERLLAKIEEGDFSVLPEPYLRAFIRSYARVVGLNPDEIIKKYEIEISSLAPKPEPVKKEKKFEIDIASYLTERPIWLIAGVALVLLIFIFIGISPEGKKEVQRKSFETAVEEISKTQIKAEEKTEPQISEPDSLNLKIITIDSVWMSVLIDSALVKEFLFEPNRSATLKAKNSFTFTIGNAGGVKFILNDRELHPVGKKGYVVRNYVINRESLKVH